MVVGKFPFLNLCMFTSYTDESLHVFASLFVIVNKLINMYTTLKDSIKLKLFPFYLFYISLVFNKTTEKTVIFGRRPRWTFTESIFREVVSSNRDHFFRPLLIQWNGWQYTRQCHRSSYLHDYVNVIGTIATKPTNSLKVNYQTWKQKRLLWVSCDKIGHFQIICLIKCTLFKKH